MVCLRLQTSSLFHFVLIPLRLKTYPSPPQYTWGSKNVLQQPFSHLRTKNEDYQNKQKIMISNQQTNISSLMTERFFKLSRGD